MKNIKKIVSVVLCFTMIIGIIAIGAHAGLNGEDVLITISTDKSSYAAGDTANVTVKVENKSGKTLSDVIITTNADNWLLAKGSNSNIADIGTLDPGASREMTFSAVVNRKADGLGFFSKIILFFKQLFSRPTEFKKGNYSGRSSTDCSVSINHGGVTVKITSICYYNYSSNSTEEDIPRFKSFFAEKYDVLVGNTESITFCAEPSNGLKKMNESIFLYSENGTKLAEMKDDGKNGDTISGDGLFSAKINLNSTKQETRNYYASGSGVKSSLYPIIFYLNLSNEQLSAGDFIFDEIMNIIKRFVATNNEENNVALSIESNNAVRDYLVDAKNKGKILEYSEDDTNFYYVVYGNIKYMFPKNTLCSIEGNRSTSQSQFEKGNYRSSSKTIELQTESSAYSPKIAVFSPFIWQIQSLVYQSHIYDTVKRIVELDIGYSNEITDKKGTQVTIESLANLNEYHVIHMYTHGSSDGSFATGEFVNSETDSAYSALLQAQIIQKWGVHTNVFEDVILFEYGKKNLYYAINPKFFTVMFSKNKLDNCLIYIGACNIGDCSETINSLLRVGAQTVIACHGETNINVYDYTRALTNNMLSFSIENDEKKLVNSVSDADSIVKSDHPGKYDNYEVFGNKNFRLTDVFASSTDNFHVPNTSDCSVGDIIEYGSYPQSRVTDDSLVSALNTLDVSWISYDYYIGTGVFADGNMKPSDYMKYKDVSYNGDKYRGVVFSKYRPNSTYTESSAYNSSQFYSGYLLDVVYWFKFEPLKWYVLDPSKGLVICTSIIDSQAFSNYLKKVSDDVYYNENGKISSDWESSSLRSWLNNNFLDWAFSSEEKAHILDATIDSNADKVFLLSYEDLINSDYGYSNAQYSQDLNRIRRGTDYAKYQGLPTIGDPVEIIWWTRTESGSCSVKCVSDGGTLSAGANVSSVSIGVVPAICLTQQNNGSSGFIGNDVQLNSKQKEEFVSFMYHVALIVQNREDEYISYSYSHPGDLFDGILLYQTMYDYDLYPGDPSGKYTITSTNGFTDKYKVSGELIDTILKERFNCSEEYISSAHNGEATNGALHNLCYSGGYYYYDYCAFGGGCIEFDYININEVKKVGNYYFVKFNTSISWDVGDDGPIYTGPMYCVLEYKNYNGTDYWSLYSLSSTGFST